MKNSSSILFCIGILLWSFTGVEAQDYISNDIQNYFKEINVNDGLSASHVNSIAKDTAGFIWIGTEFGLNRYDGNSIDIFQADIQHPTSISTNLIYDIVSDPYGDIWIATIDGLNKYQHLTEEFKVYKDKNTKNIYPDIEYDNDTKRIWIAANTGGLKYLDLEKDSIITCPLKIEPIRIKSFGSNLLIGTKDNGLIILDKNSCEVIKIIKPQVSTNIMDIALLKDDIWVATNKAGLIRFSKGDFDKVTFYNKDNSGFISDGALCLAEDKNGNLLIGTDGMGLFVFAQSKFYRIVERPNLNSLKSNTIRDIFVDNDNNIWLGTYASGVNMHPAQNRSIINYQNDYTSKNSLSKSFVLAIEEDKDKRLFIGTNRGGLNILEDNEITRVDVPGTVVLSLCKDNNDRIWLGTYQNGIYIFENNKLINLADLINDPIFNTSSAWSIAKGPEGNIWIGFTQFLAKISLTDYSYELFTNDEKNPNTIINNMVRKLFWDNKNNLWIGSVKGLSVYSFDKKSFVPRKNLSLLSNKLITSIASSNNKTFIGTNGDGVFILNDAMEVIDSLSSKHDGLVHNLIMGLVDDGRGNIWATTSNGISKINVASLEIENFSTTDGFIGNTYNPRSSKLLSSGYLAMGASQGLSIFNPDSITYNTKAPITLLTELKIHNRDISIDSTILFKSITYTKSFTLPAKHNSFSIGYVGLNYNNPQKVVYQYRLDGYDDEWTIADNKQTASYTNLPPGDYLFRVRASSGNDFWTTNPANVSITILPQWWQTIYSQIGLFFVLIGLPTLFIKLRTQSLSHQKRTLEVLVKERTSKLEKAYEQLSQFNSQLETKVNERTQKLEKSNSELDRFVYSASHDLSAPLKSITGLLNLAKVDKDTNTSVYLEKIENSIIKLEEVIKNLIQFSRNARQEIRTEKIDLNQIAEELRDELIYADSDKMQSNINCTIDVSSSFSLKSNPVRLKIILSNFISNAIKYRNEEKPCEIYIKGYEEEGKPTISVEDNGIGIEEQYIKQIFDMFYRATTQSKGSGLGLYIVKESAEKINAKIKVTSVIDKGSVFSIVFPSQI